MSKINKMETEPLVSLNQSHPRIHVDMQYWKLGISKAVQTAWLREGVAHRLVAAAESLPDGVDLLIWDAWRPVAVQQYLFEAFSNKLAAEQNLSGEALEVAVRQFVARPSTEVNNPSPHFTGGAVDVTLCDIHGNPHDLGTQFDDFSPKASTWYFEQKASPVAYDEQVAYFRRLLHHTLSRVGFVNYPEEWWHYSYGDNMHARMMDPAGSMSAIYGPILVPPGLDS